MTIFDTPSRAVEKQNALVLSPYQLIKSKVLDFDKWVSCIFLALYLPQDLVARISEYLFNWTAFAGAGLPPRFDAHWVKYSEVLNGAYPCEACWPISFGANLRLA